MCFWLLQARLSPNMSLLPSHRVVAVPARYIHPPIASNENVQYAVQTFLSSAQGLPVLALRGRRNLISIRSPSEISRNFINKTEVKDPNNFDCIPFIIMSCISEIFNNIISQVNTDEEKGMQSKGEGLST